jgi:hypothetical protein
VQTGIVVAVAPIVPVLDPGGTQTFAAKVTGAKGGQSTKVTWSVQEHGGGTVDASGNYVAPKAAGVYHIVATSAADGTKTGIGTAVVGILAADRVAPWIPGIPGGIPVRTKVCSKIGAPMNDGKTDATAVIQAAMDGCPVGQVVSLAAGSYKITASLIVRKGITLRGAGSTQTKILATLPAGSEAAIYVRNNNPTFGTPAMAVTADVLRGATVIPVTNGGAFSVGDIVQIDQFDDTTYLYDGQDPYFKRPDYGPPDTSLGELVGTGDGSKTSFTATVAAKMVNIGSLQISSGGKALGNNPADSGSGCSGTIAATNGIASGSTIDYCTGALVLHLATAPAKGAFITVSYGTGAHRSLGQTSMVTAVKGNNLTIADPIHLGFKLSESPQVFKPDGPPPMTGSTDPPGIIKYAGVEDLYVTGGQNDEIHVEECAFCWVAGVESDGTTPAASTASNGTAGPGLGMVGAHVLIDKSYRVIIRDSYFHHASAVVQGGGAYGISFSRHTSESLVENNIIYYMNKPLTMRASGGGNVVGYNYVDDAWTSVDTRLQETTVDMGHTSFPYMELLEGNYSPQIATENVWGNSGWMTIFRNQATSQQQRTKQFEKYQIAAISFEAEARQLNVVGNVLGAKGVGLVYEVHSNPPGAFTAAVWRLGQGVGAGAGGDNINAYENPNKPDSTAAELFRHANWDYVHETVTWDPSISTHDLPDSLYLAGKPPFFGNATWPWVDPVGQTKAYTLPAKARFDACKGPSFCP